MAVNSVTNPNASAQAAAAHARNAERAANEKPTPGHLRQQVHAETNALVLKGSLEVSIQSGDQSQQLVFRTAIDKLNELLEPELGKDAIQNATNQDNTPEGTAGRIVSLSTGFFEAFAAQRPGQDLDTTLKQFGEVIGKGIEQGFKEARGILDGLKVLQGDIAGNIDKTEELVKKGLQDFLDSQRKAAEQPASTGTT